MQFNSFVPPLYFDKGSTMRTMMTAHALKEIISHASHVVIMGHEFADYDSLGASVGLARIACDMGKETRIALDRVNSNIDKLLSYLPIETKELFKIGEMGLGKLLKGALLIVVDTHKPSLLAVPKVLEESTQVVVIDHHCRNEEFIDNAALVYLDPTASSASEIVSELLRYYGSEFDVTYAEATALLAGLAVDTKNFLFNTGVRTFEAASFLRGLGADPGIVQGLLRDDLEVVIKKAGVIKNTRIIYGHIALGISDEESEDAQLVAAKTADAMLNIAGVDASFVLWPYQGGVAISSRSNGKINVQNIMEKLGGGGHYSIAAAQVNDSIDNVENFLLEVLDKRFFHTDQFDIKKSKNGNLITGGKGYEGNIETRY